MESGLSICVWFSVWALTLYERNCVYPKCPAGASQTFWLNLSFISVEVDEDFLTSRPKATGWGLIIIRRVPSATTSAAPTSPTSVWHTAARRSRRSCSSSLTPCALWSWTPLMRRMLCPWGPSLDDPKNHSHLRKSPQYTWLALN